MPVWKINALCQIRNSEILDTNTVTTQRHIKRLVPLPLQERWHNFRMNAATKECVGNEFT